MKISIETIVKADLETVWHAWNNPEDIKQWNAASDDWHTTESTVDLREGGTFSSRMEAKDKSIGFDFTGSYTKIVEKQLIEYSLDDSRSVLVQFTPVENGVKVKETFEAESQNEAELQRQGWQSILNNFTKHVESKKKSVVRPISN
jgi:uncharacterized protein YndB with AHSA1/START domain